MHLSQKGQRHFHGCWRNISDGGLVELYVLSLDEGTCCVVAVAGELDAPVAPRIRSQGPFPGDEVGRGVCRSIARALESRGYRRGDETAEPHWELAAWRAARQLRVDRAPFTPDSHFRPEDVIF